MEPVKSPANTVFYKTIYLTKQLLTKHFPNYSKVRLPRDYLEEEKEDDDDDDDDDENTPNVEQSPETERTSVSQTDDGVGLLEKTMQKVQEKVKFTSTKEEEEERSQEEQALVPHKADLPERNTARETKQDCKVNVVLVVSCIGLSVSSVTKKDENAAQQRKPTEAFPCENQDRISKMSPFTSRRVSTKRSRSSSPVKIEIKLEESDEECDLVIDVPPQAVKKKPRISRNCTSGKRDKELAAVICAGKLRDSATVETLGHKEEKTDQIVTLRRNGKILNTAGKLGNVFPKANEIYLPDVNTDKLKVLEGRDALAYSKEKHKFSAASIEADTQKGILKEGNAETNILVKAFVQEHTTNEDCVSSGRVTQSVLRTGHSSKDETTIERPYKKIIINTEESQSIEEDGGNNSHTYPYPTYYLNKKESGITLSSSAEQVGPSGEDTELSESDDPLEECRRIFDEFEREAQKKGSDKQARGRDVDLNLLEIKANAPGRKRRIAHTAKFDALLEFAPVLVVNVTCESNDASVNLLEAQPVETSSGQLHILLEGNVTRMPCELSVSSFQKATLVPRKALLEEQSVYDRCGGKKMYLNFAVKTLKKLRDHGQLGNSRSSSGAESIKSEERKAFTDGALYELLKDYLLTEEQLNENNFPRPNPEKNGSAILTGVVKNAGYDVPGGMEKRYKCCERIVGSAGCQTAKLHVHDGRRNKLEGFMKTLTKSPPFDGNYGVYALDCETCYTTHGLELTRVTVVDAKLQVVYDTFVKPDGKVIDYDIRLSGAREDDLKNTTTSLRDVQAVLLNLFSADTIVIGHSLENALFTLKNKLNRVSNKLVDLLLSVKPSRQKIIFCSANISSLPRECINGHIEQTLMSFDTQWSSWMLHLKVAGHNSKEDAIACMELILWKVKEGNKKRKR
ncbi:hypothetical protein llap_3479 [Limosa lapponica baueri]|uniref:Exonuclease domain-containing protein n=1 Tax=Limosa lapponica baueri TaxID=1758121 RepID=A0A2I0UJN2_LIMLA|nr:hypothetical protein llap_3479 [Limosa lapponica baueri]